MSSGGPSLNRGVGRARELATAAFARDTARTGLGSMLAVTGASGSGKTWLCESIAESAAHEGFRVGWGAGWPGGGVPLLWPWQQALGPFSGQSVKDLFDAPPGVDSADWFGRCVAVVDHLRDLTASDRPTVLILDDLHHADEATRQLAYFVARHLRGMPLLLVVAHEPAPDLDALDKEATAIALRGLGPAETAAVLAARGIEPLPETDLAFVVEATGGLPGALHRLATAARDAAGIVQALVDQRVTELPDDLVQGAARAAVVGPSPRLGEIAAVVGDGIDPAALAVELDRLGLAGRGPDGVTFGHEQVRTALAATLDPADVLDVHACLVDLLATGPPSPDRLERRWEHARAIAGRSPADALVAVRAAQDLAAALVTANDPVRAADVLAAAETAHEAAGLGRPPAGVLAARGAALLRCGHLGAARDQFRRAVEAAEDEGDATSFAVSALGLGGVWLAEERSPIERERFLDLVRRARDELPEGEVTLRLRLDTRLAAERAYETGDVTGIEAQVAAARALGEPSVLAEALSLYHHTLLGPVHRETRAAVAEEMLSVAARANDHTASLMALLWLTANQFLAGSPQAERTLGVLHERAEAMSGRHVAYIARVMDTMLLQREGRVADAEQAAEAAFALGAEVGDADAVGYYGAQLVVLRWIQGRAAEVLDLAAETEASPTITPANQAFTASLASLAAACGELDRARAALRRLRGRLHMVHQSSAWLVTLFSTVEAAYVLGDVEIAREAAALLAPYADLPVLGSLGVSCVGSVRRSLGLAAVAAGDLDEGIAHLEAAVAENERLGNRPLAAITAADLAEARAKRGRAGDRAAALDLLDQAVREADAMGLPIRAKAWRDHRGALAGDAAGTRAPLDDEVGTIRRRGRSWLLGVAAHEVVVPDLLGMGYLVRLLDNPGVEIAASVLVASGSDLASGSRSDQPVLDDAALGAYRRRVTELEDDLAEAERNADSERASRIRLELDAVVDELTRTTNWFGRARTFTSSDERARTAVQKAVRRTLDHIEGVDATLGGALRRSVRTGKTCCYEPGPGAPARWVHIAPA